MFRGHFDHTVDDKGRVAIPSRFREELSRLQDERLVATKFKVRGRPCLDVYPQSAWSRLEDELTSKNVFDAALTDFMEVYVSTATDVPLDSQGRILLPLHLRQFARLARDATFTGRVNLFRIWDKGTWEQVSSEAEQILDQPEVLKGLDLRAMRGARA